MRYSGPPMTLGNAAKAGCGTLRLWVVRSREENPPPDSKPLDWMLCC